MDPSPVDHEQERQLLLDALRRSDPRERTEFLANACDRDVELRRRVEAMLWTISNAELFLTPREEDPASSQTHTADHSRELTLADRGATLGDDTVTTPVGPGHAALNPPSSAALDQEFPPDMNFGPYRVLRPIGEGGMGRVYLAEQLQPIKRLVALKIVKPGMDSREVVARFEAERQALALMDHPHVARVYDAGQLPFGRPYFVMEYVEGRSITQFCDEETLGLPDRLALFIRVCHAIGHAHQKAVLHRDIKPSNILVTRVDGEVVPKVIDFGVAKALGATLTEGTLVTQVGAVVGTLQYMSPEQASGARDVDTRSDIYALGVLLYELLTGQPPLDRDSLRGVDPIEILRRVREDSPPKPSARLSSLGQSLVSVAAQEPAANAS